MKKTFTINISGAVFHIDDDAYDKLRQYLNALNTHFGSSDEGHEIVSDIEARIAELFQEKMKGANTVVNLTWVDEVIEVMGTPQDFMEEDEDQEPASAPFTPPFQKRNPKARRLYRDPDNRVLGGVCGGLGAYFKFDAVILRIILGILVIFPSFIFAPSGGTILIVYILLWIVVPKAKSVAQRLEMKGEDVNVSNIEKTVKDEYESVKDKFNEFKQSETYAKGRQGFSKVGGAAASSGKMIGKLIVILIGAFLMIVGVSSLLGISIGVTATDGFLTDLSLWDDNVNFSMLTDHFVNGSDLTWIYISLFLVMGIPAIMLIFVGSKLIFKYKTNNALIGLSALGLWIISVIVLASSVIGQLGNFKSSTTKTISDNIQAKSDTLYLKLNQFDYTVSTDPNLSLNDMRLVENEGEYLLIGEPRLDIEESSSDKVILQKRFRSRGKNHDNAREHLEEVIYNYKSSEDAIYFDEHFKLSEDGKWRDQTLKLTLKIPVGQVIYLDDKLIKIIYDIENVSNVHDRDMVGKYWVMTEEGLTLSE
ncbi:PspC domain-containing protein [Prolixibacteraceae bacterium JC049]|nr:PspC domain-containing protein [Prolixibacteraceae bacterium JC049]